MTRRPPFRRVVLNRLATIRWLRDAKDRLSPPLAKYGSPEYTIDVVARHARRLESAGFDPLGKAIVELGPGGNLGGAVVFSLLGASRVVCVDNFDHQISRAALAAFYADLERRLLDALPADPPLFGRDLDQRCLEAIRSGGVKARLAEHVDFLCPVDASNLPIETASVDAVFSQAVLEHVRRPAAVIEESFRVLRQGGLASHEVDLGDHLDREGMSMLCYSDDDWEAIASNSNGYVNRVRFDELKALFFGAGFEVLEFYCRSAAPLERLPVDLADRFVRSRPDELAKLDAIVLARRGIHRILGHRLA